MTIKVTVKNEDSREKAVITVAVVEPEGKFHNQKEDDLTDHYVHKWNGRGGDIKVLKGGQSCDMYVHSSQSLLITEIENG